jgi:hypothetical protein
MTMDEDDAAAAAEREFYEDDTNTPMEETPQAETPTKLASLTKPKALKTLQANTMPMTQDIHSKTASTLQKVVKNHSQKAGKLKDAPAKNTRSSGNQTVEPTDKNPWTVSTAPEMETLARNTDAIPEAMDESASDTSQHPSESGGMCDPEAIRVALRKHHQQNTAKLLAEEAAVIAEAPTAPPANTGILKTTETMTFTSDDDKDEDGFSEVRQKSKTTIDANPD